jgi:radical SAM superfamily enzyme YgiQ (UPF0313 family)
MKITFIRPNINDKQSADAMEPIVFAILAAHTPPDVEISFFDERVERLLFNDKPDLVALSVETHTAKRAYQIAAHYRCQGVAVVMGGYHPSLLPDEVLQFADSIVIGDAEEQWPKLINDFKAGSLKRVYKQHHFPQLNNQQGDFSIFQNKKYGKIKPVQAGRGCKYACDFCSINAFYGNTIRQRPLDDVVAEIEALDTSYFFLVDDNLFANRPQIVALLNALIPLKIRWGCQTSIDIACDAELMDLLTRSGCFLATIGFESLNAANLKQMKKGSNLKYHDYDLAIRQFHDRGIMIYGTFIFGYDGDTVDSFESVVDFALRSKFCLANFNPLTPTPGSPLYRRLEKEGRLIYKKWWINPSYRYGQAIFRPSGMSPQELTDGCLRARKRFHTFSSIFSRALNTKANSHSINSFCIYLLANYINRKEIFAKQGSMFGAPMPQLAMDNLLCE